MHIYISIQNTPKHVGSSKLKARQAAYETIGSEVSTLIVYVRNRELNYGIFET